MGIKNGHFPPCLTIRDIKEKITGILNREFSQSFVFRQVFPKSERASIHPPQEKIDVQYIDKSVMISKNNNMKAQITPLSYIT